LGVDLLHKPFLLLFCLCIHIPLAPSSDLARLALNQFVGLLVATEPPGVSLAETCRVLRSGRGVVIGLGSQHT
jgi:hypothetical protein